MQQQRKGDEPASASEIRSISVQPTQLDHWNDEALRWISSGPAGSETSC